LQDKEKGLRTELFDALARLEPLRQTDEGIEALEKYMRGGSVLALPEEYQRAAGTVRHLFDEAGRGIIRVGIAEGKAVETINTGLGTYLPRLYLRYEGEDSLLKVADWLKETGAGTWRLGQRNYVKARDESIPEHIREAWGEIHDTVYLAGKRLPPTMADIHARELQNFIAASEHTLPDTVVRIAGEPPPRSAINRFRAQAKKKGLKGSDADAFVQKKTTQAFGGTGADNPMLDAIPQDDLPRYFERAAGKRRDRMIEHNGKLYYKMPDSSAWGPLAGKYVGEDVAYNFLTAAEVAKSGMKLLSFKGGIRFFKRSKVTWNPATLMRNIYGQVPLNDFAGIPPWRLDKYIAAGRDFATGSEGPGLYAEARKFGLYGGEWPQVEAGMLRKHLEQAGGGGLEALQEWAMDAAQKPFRSMERFHEASEQFAKTLVYRHARINLGMDPTDAVRYTKRYAYDYGEVSRLIEWSRESPFGAPFISFTYKSMPRMMEKAIAIGNPMEFWKYWKYPLGLSAANEYSARKFGLVEEDEKGPVKTLWRVTKNALNLGVGRVPTEDMALQKWLPSHVGTQQVLLSWLDDFGRFHHGDATYILPWGDIGETGKGNVGRAFAEVGVPVLDKFPRQLEPSNPYMQVGVAALSGGYNVFLQRPIIDPGMDIADRLFAYPRFIAQSFGPSLFPGVGYSAEALRKSFEGDLGDPSIPRPFMAALGHLGGLKTRATDPRTGASFKVRELTGEMDKLVASKKVTKQ
jgi:hypothetical protein